MSQWEQLSHNCSRKSHLVQRPHCKTWLTSAWHFAFNQPFAGGASFKQCCVPVTWQNHPVLCNTKNVSSHGPAARGEVSSEMVSDEQRKRSSSLWLSSPPLARFLGKFALGSFLWSSVVTSPPSRSLCGDRQGAHSVIVLKMIVSESFDY